MSNTEGMKRCPGCGHTLPPDAFYIGKRRGRPFRHSRCKDCERASRRDYFKHRYWTEPGYREARLDAARAYAERRRDRAE